MISINDPLQEGEDRRGLVSTRVQAILLLLFFFRPLTCQHQASHSGERSGRVDRILTIRTPAVCPPPPKSSGTNVDSVNHLGVIQHTNDMLNDAYIGPSLCTIKARTRINRIVLFVTTAFCKQMFAKYYTPRFVPFKILASCRGGGLAM